MQILFCFLWVLILVLNFTCGLTCSAAFQLEFGLVLHPIQQIFYTHFACKLPRIKCLFVQDYQRGAGLP